MLLSFVVPTVFIRRATRPPSSSTVTSGAVALADESADVSAESCSPEVMFCAESSTPPTGYSRSAAARLSVMPVTVLPPVSASGCTISSWQSFSCVVMPSSSACAASLRTLAEVRGVGEGCAASCPRRTHTTTSTTANTVSTSR